MKYPLKLMSLVLSLVFSVGGLHAQNNSVAVNWRDARITDVGAYLIDLEMKVVEDPVTHKIDTIETNNSRIVWASEGIDVVNVENNSFFKGEELDIHEFNTGDDDVDAILNSTRKGLRRVSAKEQNGCLHDIAFDKFYYNVFKFEYPSVDADGNVVTLSAMAACPPKDGTTRVNNVILGTHITITADYQRPSAQDDNFKQDDWGLIFSLAANNKMSYKKWFTLLKYFVLSMPVGINVFEMMKDINHMSNVANSNNCLVIMPDYEGYGVTVNRAHPYLYQELTARQCIDALMYGKALYNSDPELENIRHPLRDDYRCMSVGYSQGGSVAMACHRFIEQNGLNKDLHFVGSLCGDGPYDPMATLMYYVKNDLDGKTMSMAVVLPLIMKGMLDTNPYMRNHKPGDYFSEKFLNTGIMNWLAEKQMTTGDIEDGFKNCYKNGYNGNTTYFRDIFNEDGSIMMSKIMNQDCFNYFKKIYNANKDTFTDATGIALPTKRGVFEDLHFALASNDMTKAWVPKGKVILFHSMDDTVVPFVNAQSAKNRLGDKVTLESIAEKDHVPAGVAFFSQDKTYQVVFFNGLRLINYVNEMCNWNY